MEYKEILFMDKNVKIAKELVKIAKELVALKKPLNKVYSFPESQAYIYHQTVYKSDFKMHGRYTWTYNEPSNMDIFSEDDCIVVRSKSGNIEAHRTLIDNGDKFKSIGMQSAFEMERNYNTSISFDAMYIGMYTPEKMNKLVALMTELLGENPTQG